MCKYLTLWNKIECTRTINIIMNSGYCFYYLGFCLSGHKIGLILPVQQREIPRATFHQLLRCTVLCCLTPARTPNQAQSGIGAYELDQGNSSSRNVTSGSLRSLWKACAYTAGNNLSGSASGQAVTHNHRVLGATISYHNETKSEFQVWKNWMWFSPQEQNNDFASSA